jgi:hypothetical protein
MPYPRLRKNDNNLYPGPEGAQRDRELQDETNEKDVFTPYAVELRDIDEQIAVLLETGVLSLTAEGKAVPVVTVDTERWAEFAKTWQIQNSDNNINPPLITVRRTKEEVGTMMGPRFSIPNKKYMTTLRVPTFENGIAGFRLFQMRQPTRIDCLYEVRLIALVKEDVDQMSQNFLREYTDRQLYIKVKGYYFPTVLEDMDDENTMEDIDADRYYIKIFNIRAMGFVQREEDFQEIDAPNRIITVTEVNGTQLERTAVSIDGRRNR